MPNPVIHFEAVGNDGDKLREFYSAAFGWEFNVMPEMGYGTTDNGGRGIGGGVGAVGDGGPNTTFYVAVPDPQATLDLAESLGGQTAMPVMEIPNIVTLAQFKDPEGNIIGLVKDMPGEVPAPTSAPAEYPVTWFEIVGRDGAALREFYGKVFGWQFNVMEGADYGMVDNGGQGIDGGVGTAPEPHACWYVEVPDPQAHLERVVGLGATVIMPVTDLGMVTVAMFNDPEGSLVGLFKSNQ